MEKQHTPEKQKPVEHKQKIAEAPIKQEVKEEKSEIKKEIEAKVQEMKDEKQETKTEGEEKKAEETKGEKKGKKEIVKKEKAVVIGKDLPISKKHSMSVCNFIRYRRIESIIPELEKVTRLEKAIPMKGEIPHRKGKMMSGRYPVNSCKVFIKLLKTLNANSSVNGIENPIISVAIANDASRPFKRGGSARFKRTNVHLESREKVEGKK